jgi:uncharacterized protein (DUF1800 family)
MRSVGLVVGIAVLLATAGSISGDATGRFDVKLALDKQPLHVLNRLAYGPRPGDLDEVRKLGAEAWIRQQLNPAKIAESPVLDAKLKPLVTVQLATWEIFEKFQQNTAIQLPPPTPLQQLLPIEQAARLTNQGTSLEDRRAILATLAKETRRQVMAQVNPQVFTAAPDLQQEAQREREIQNEVRSRMQQEQLRRQRPQLADLLTPEESRDIRLGTPEEKTAVIMSLSPEKRTQVFRALNQDAQNLPNPYRREALAIANPQQAVVNEVIEAKLLRAAYSSRQLEEVLVDFWFNHFNVDLNKGQVRMLLTSYERDAIRPHVLGRFRDMLLATARHPAMLFYLDNYQSRGPQIQNVPAGVIVSIPPPPPGQGLNENYGREVMELHTLGVGGGYTQDDVVNVARAFTGWTIFNPQNIGEFQFNPAMHDRGEKVVLGRAFPRGGGESEGVTVIDMLASHPSTAKFISRKLAQRFVADDPPQALVDRMAATFTKTDGDLRAVMETLLLSKEFMSEGAWQAKVKSPFEMVVSSLRALNADVTDTTAIAQRIAGLGQPLYGKTEPTGYPNTGESWTSSAGLLGRMNFATALMAGQVSGAKVNPEPIAAAGIHRAMSDLTGVAPSADVLAAIDKGSDGKPPAPTLLATVLIGSPDFQKR